MLKGYCIADIHFGSVNSKSLTNQLDEYFFKKIKNKKFDLLVIAGDLLDHKLSFNSESSKSCIEFLNKLVLLSKKNKFSIRIIKGTKNHDLDQLNNFLYLQKRTDIDFKIINNVQDEIINNTRILYVPEEYMEDPKEYYKDYFYNNNEYDICFGHGTFNHCEFVNKTIESERPISNAPIFSYKQFNKLVKGPVLFGHIHIASSYRNKIFYVGSFSRWKYGEEKNKGFMSFNIDDEDNYEVKFIKNPLADLYITKNLSEIINLKAKNLENEIENIKKYKEENNIQNLRIVMDNDFYDKVDKNIIKKYFLNLEDDNIKISSSNQVQRTRSDNSENETKYSFIFNKKFSLAKIISEYLRIHDNITLKESIIEDILYSEE